MSSPPAANAIDYSGQYFGKLTAIRDVGRHPRGNRLWECRCDCGQVEVVASCNLRARRGCHRCTYSTHGKSGTRIYSAYKAMIQRCLNPNNPSYPDYGGRGITVCHRWLNFENFLKDMGDRPAGTTLGRIENNKGYKPSNCAWQTHEEQANNRRDNRYIDFAGRHLTVAQWERLLNIPGTALQRRIHRTIKKWTPQALVAAYGPQRMLAWLAADVRRIDKLSAHVKADQQTPFELTLLKMIVEASVARKRKHA